MTNKFRPPKKRGKLIRSEIANGKNGAVHKKSLANYVAIALP